METNKSKTRYFHAKNCLRPFRHNGVDFKFYPYSLFAGSWFGILATDDEKEIRAIESMMKSPTSAITETTKEDYILARNQATRDITEQWPMQPLPKELEGSNQVAPAPDAAAAIAKEESKEKASLEGTPLESLDDALSPSKIEDSGDDDDDSLDPPAMRKKRRKK